MKKLFIIGNGFDVDHNLHTRYSDFQKYLIESYPEASDEQLVVPSSFTMPDGDERYDDDAVVGFLLRIITDSEGTGEDWKDLENTLGNLDFSYCFDSYGYEEDDDDDGDGEEWHRIYNNEDISLNILESVKMIKEYFSDWAQTIDISSAQPKDDFSKLIDADNDLFLTLNYTETLQRLYKAKHVFHIHGKQGGEIVFGHGNDTDYYDTYSEHYLGAENNLCSLQSALRKDTKGIISRNKHFFKMLDTVDSIYSYGFSFSDVDMDYVKEICRVTDTSIMVWYFNDYDDEKKINIFKEKIRNCGYKGKFDTFTIEK